MQKLSRAVSCGAQVEAWHIDLGLFGSQKALSLLPTLGMVTVSDRAWRVIHEVTLFALLTVTTEGGSCVVRPYAGVCRQGQVCRV